MNFIRSSLRAQLIASLGGVSVVFCIAVAVGWIGLSSVSSSVKSGYGKAMVANEASAAAYNMHVSQIQDALNARRVTNPDGSDMHGGDIAAFSEVFNRLKAMATTAADRSAVGRIQAAFTAWQAMDVKSEAAWKSGSRTDTLAIINGSANSSADALSKALQSYALEVKAQADSEAATSQRNAQLMMLGFVAAAIIAGLAIILFLCRAIGSNLSALAVRLRSLSENCLTSLTRGLGAITEGDLTVSAEPVTTPVDNPGRDEIGDLSRTFNEMLSKVQDGLGSYNTMRGQLGDMIGEITSTSGTVSAASEEMAATSESAGRTVAEIATAINDVADGATRQVGIVEQARSAAEDTARAASQARQVAEEGASASEKATHAMHLVRESSVDVTAAIQSLAERSAQIGGIVETITGIARQTNLLALNAAIEAARAGEQGRGFAVVAEEVRQLAEESQQAAASISELISEIQGETSRAVGVVEEGARRSEDGAAVVEQAREAFDQISRSIAAVSESAEQIAQATGEVAAVAEQSSATTEQVAASTQETSATTQEIASSAHDLAGSAEELSRLVARFRVG
jgi:methyl-accepting chemotaxis protein